MGDTRKRRERTNISKIKPPEAQNLHGIAENLYTLQQDLVTASKIQNRLLPPKPELRGYDFEVYYQPAGEVGGEWGEGVRRGTGENQPTPCPSLWEGG